MYAPNQRNEDSFIFSLSEIFIYFIIKSDLKKGCGKRTYADNVPLILWKIGIFGISAQTGGQNLNIYCNAA